MGVNVEHGTILNIDVAPYPDPVDVPPDNRPEPDARAIFNHHIADNVSPIGHKYFPG
jgi:hypothetical protein